MPTFPVVFTVKLGVDVSKPVISPDPEVNNKDVVPTIGPDGLVIVPLPLAAMVVVAPFVVVPPKAMLPLLLVAVSENVPRDKNVVVVVMLLSLDRVKLANISSPEVSCKAPAPVLTTVALPVVFNVMAVVDVAILPMVPDPDSSDIDVLPLNVPPVCDIAPEPLAESVTTVPPASKPRAIPPLFAVVIRESDPAELSDVAVVILLLLDTENVVNVEPSDDKLKAYPELVMPALPVVSIVKLGVDVAIPVISPDVEVRVTDVVPVTLPVVCVIAPEPLAANATTVPPRLSAKLMPPGLLITVKDTEPDEVSAFVVEIPLSFCMFTEAKVSPPEVMLSASSTFCIFTFPVVFTVTEGVLV